MQSRDQYALQALGQPACERLKRSKVLMVGAGGIGCELLKDLVLLGVPEIHIVDLDTIDLSNLNRQFLFRHEHIKRSKAEVAKESASKFNPNVNIVAHHANIKDPKFNVKWFRSFAIVYNALDNVDARRHVNRLCLAADVPLIESGTAGFNGQVQVILPGQSECYDCHPKPVTKTFAVCTIRSTPSQPIHCVVWAKSYLLSQIFDDTEAEAETVAQGKKDGENAAVNDKDGNSLHVDGTGAMSEEEELQELQREANALRILRQSMTQQDFAQRLFDKVFGSDIERLLSMESMWKSRKPPVPLSYLELEAKVKDVDIDTAVANDHKVALLEENFVLFRHSLDRLVKRFKQLKEQNSLSTSSDASIPFDKDDQDTMDFVSSAANIRAHIFSIPLSSKFNLKQIAGNIIPAIATTNAVIAGLSVLQSLKVFSGDGFTSARNVFISRLPERIFISEKLHAPNPHCVVSGVARAVIKTDPEKFKLQDLVESLLKLDLGYTDELSVVTDQLLYDPDFEDNLNRTLADLHIGDGSFVTIIDEEDEGKVNLELYIEAAKSVETYELASKPELPKKVLAPSGDGETVETVSGPEVRTQKRKQEEQRPDDESSTAKRRKVEGVEDQGGDEQDQGKGGDNVVVIDDDDVLEID